MDLERVIRLTHDGRVYTFRVEQDGPLACWRVDVDGRTHHLPLRALGDELPAFFRSIVGNLADAPLD